jgi:hypothetical protein
MTGPDRPVEFPGWIWRAGSRLVQRSLPVGAAGFGLDSAIEAMASVIVIWRFTGSRLGSPTSERRAQS